MFRLMSPRIRLATISLLERVSAGRTRQRKEHPIVSLIHTSNSCHVPSKCLFVLCSSFMILLLSYPLDKLFAAIYTVIVSILAFFCVFLFAAIFDRYISVHHITTHRTGTHRGISTAMIIVWTTISLYHYFCSAIHNILTKKCQGFRQSWYVSLLA